MIRSERVLHTEPSTRSALIKSVRSRALPLRTLADLDPLLERIGDARYVLLGEASHGTDEYYAWRAALSRRLIEEKDFTFVAVEGDWPDCYRLNRFVRGLPQAGDDAVQVLRTFQRWPTWMWANEEIAEFAGWLRQHNDSLPKHRNVGFYGLDVYSLWDSLYEVMSYLRRTDPSSLNAARRAFHCFEPYGEDEQLYAQATRLVSENCEDETVALLQELLHRAPRFESDGREAHFAAEQNAYVVKSAEAYYRTMVRGGPESWNVRDRHMAETLDRLMNHRGSSAKAILWEHNTHIGDARYTDMADNGMVNVGQLVRAAHTAEGVVLVGFGSHRGSVIAASEWDATPESMTVPRARSDSWDDVLHRALDSDRLLLLHGDKDDPQWLEWRGQRAIGVVYHPRFERFGNYVPTVLPCRYDALLYLDVTEALHPLATQAPIKGELPETFPSGL